MNRSFIANFVLLLIVLPALAAAQQSDPCPANGSELQQLRIYELNYNNKDDFHRSFRDHVLHIMKRLEFNVLDVWESDSGTKIELVYLLSWTSKAAMESHWNDFLTDEEWIAVKNRTTEESGTLVNSISARTLSRMAYSPVCSSQ